MFSHNGKNQPVYSELPLSFASPIISTRTVFPWAPLSIGLPVILAGGGTGLPLVLSCQPFMCALGLRCQPGDLYIHAGPPLIGPVLSPYLLVRVFQFLSLIRALSTVNRIHVR